VSRLVEILIERAESVSGELGAGEAKDEIDRALTRLREPLRVALTGGVSAGKSTILNALLGSEVAPTAAGECTQVVTLYRAGTHDRAVLHLTDGTSRELPMSRGRLPEDLQVDAGKVARIEVRLQNERLEELVVIDTPGLNSAGERNSERTESFFGMKSREAVFEADAIVYVIASPPSDFDRTTLEGISASAFNTLGVVNKADRLGGVEDRELSDAAALASSAREHLAAHVGDFVPLAGLLAATARTSLREADVRHLRTLSELPADELETLLLSPDMFRDLDCPVSRSERERLLEMLDMFGIHRAVEWARAGGRSAKELREELLAISGFESLRGVLRRTITSRADDLKAQAALAQLRVTAYKHSAPSGSPLRRLRSDLDDITIRPEWGRLICARALAMSLDGTAEIKPEMMEDLRSLAVGATIEERAGLTTDVSESELRTHVSERLAAWRRLRGFAHNSEMRQIADMAEDGFQHLLAEAREGAS
jgi:hypothetical protein